MDMGKNPEAQYRRYRPDYTGMDVQEFTFCTMEDLFGRPCALQADRITAQGAGKPQPVVIFVHGGGFSEPNDKRQAYISRFARPLTAAGYTVFSPDYPQYDSPTSLPGPATSGKPAAPPGKPSTIYISISRLTAASWAWMPAASR